MMPPPVQLGKLKKASFVAAFTPKIAAFPEAQPLTNMVRCDNALVYAACSN